MSPPRIQDVPRPSTLTDEDRQREQPRADAEVVREMRQYMEQRSEEQLEMWKMLREMRQENAALRRMNEQLRTKVEDLEKDSEVQQEAAFATPEEREHEHPREEEGEQPGGDQGQKGQRAETEEPSSSTTDCDQKETVKVMLSLMQGMQEMQRQMMDNKRKEEKDEEEKGVEWVRGGTQDLPRLAEWSASTGPIDFNDWLNLIEPQMSDLTATSGEWWKRLLGEARLWYEEHQRLPPLKRMDHDARPSDGLSQKKWHRLERRASTLLLAALPESQREELVSARKLSAMEILCQLLVAYQPGGLAEKELILRSLEQPPEAATISEAVVGLRRWARWRRRALDFGSF